MTGQRIAIVGGGMAGLAAAFALTRRELCQCYKVTVYQMGWRVGGKCASGRDKQGRNIEHGLHIWFGFYENAFRMMHEVYDEWDTHGAPKIPLHVLLCPQEFTPIGDGDVNKPDVYDVEFPPDKGTMPGKGSVDLSIGACLSRAVGLLGRLHDHALDTNPSPEVDLDAPSSRTLARGNDPRLASGIWDKAKITAKDCLEISAVWLSRLDDDMILFGPEDVELVRRMLKNASDATKQMIFARRRAGELLSQALSLAEPFVSGVIADILIEQRSINQIDSEDFRHWLVRHGAPRGLVKRTPLVKSLYDTMFQYPDGDITKASYGAGTAVQVLLRMLGTYRGAVAWELQAGTGEVIVAPLFELLRQRGVQFKFFHKLTDVHVSPDTKCVESLHFDVQAIPRPDYEWTTRVRGGMVGWSNQPNWDQIEGNPNRNADLESFWCNEKVGIDVVRRGEHFDDVILAAPLGTFKKFTGDKKVERRPRSANSSRPEPPREPFDDLYEYNTRFWNMAAKLQLVPSISVQLWSDRTLVQLGWTKAKPALVSGPDPLDIWADMSQLLQYEPSGPASLHYLCDVFPSKLYEAPRTRPGVQALADLIARLKTLKWLKRKSRFIWPNVMAQGKFDWRVLFDRAGRTGPPRLAAQYIKANIGPWDCCVATAAGTSAWRLKTNDSGFVHLYLAGTWIDTGFNTECVETAVISGMQAARAITGESIEIPGERFLHPSRQYLSVCDVLRGCAHLG
ncbi:NAD(P)-binding protein [Bradyrhizobium arachidis]|uniref:NAD(P)-binding protein n=1 Tax=Bradyrhizobium arachidis TaxID=858423 RepID=UPI002161B336|nr:NAD(P)-binding protein [Bradyrhizobium arachidis]UVO27600.1 NAD(P)-binding protein [Bradyrhizobium arachidis]